MSNLLVIGVRNYTIFGYFSSGYNDTIKKKKSDFWDIITQRIMVLWAWLYGICHFIDWRPRVRPAKRRLCRWLRRRRRHRQSVVSTRPSKTSASPLRRTRSSTAASNCRATTTRRHTRPPLIALRTRARAATTTTSRECARPATTRIARIAARLAAMPNSATPRPAN